MASMVRGGRVVWTGAATAALLAVVAAGAAGLARLGEGAQPPAASVGDDPASLRQAAADGDAGAAYRLGLALRNGYGVQADAAGAIQWFAMAAQRNQADALFALSNVYRYGEGVASDEAKALGYLRRAVELDHPAAAQTLALAYLNGELGLPKDSGQYRFYLAEAAHAQKHYRAPSLLHASR